MQKLEIPLDDAQERALGKFFIEHPEYLNVEHYIHTRSPLDNLKHYMWEELAESYHVDILASYQRTGIFDDDDLRSWVKQEHIEQAIIKRAGLK